jgi:CubicO group peptidase (beta-lactamase class C family)
MKLLLPYALVLVVGTTATATDRFDTVRAAIRAQLRQRQVPSVTVAVSQGSRIVWEEGFGWANRERMIPASANTMYSLASISKPMTATALMTLVNSGKIDLDKPINDYLGSAKLRARIGDAREATVRRVANHSAGLPEHYQFFYENEPWRPPSPDETILRYGNLLSPPGERYRYSNLGYGILSAVIARTSGKTFADYLREEVFLKLGMTRSTVGADEALADVRAIGYGVDGQPIPLYTTDHDGASAVFASAHDLVRFGMWNLKLHLADQAAILPDSLIDAMHAPTMSEGDGDGYGVGWETTNLAGYRALVHTGGMPGVATVLRIIPSERIVIVVLCNAEDDDLASSIADDIMRVLLPKWKPPAVKAADSIGAFAPPQELVGVWKGKVATYDSEIPLTLTVPSSGDVHVKLGDQLEAVLSRARFTGEGLLRGSMPGSLGIKDAARRPYFLGLTLKLRNGNVLNGAITARANDQAVVPTNGLYPSVAGQPAPDRIQANAFILAQWAELTKQ